MIKICTSVQNISVYSCQPKTRDELRDIIEDRISKEGYECDLNDIDTSKITDMSHLFYNSRFNGNISRWNVSNVENMDWMFAWAKFNGDISNWDVSKVENMESMFRISVFNGDISNWNIDKNCNTNYMFNNCPIKEEYKPKSLQRQ